MDFLVLKPVKGYNSFNTIFKNGKKFYENELLSTFSEKLWFNSSSNPDDFSPNILYFGVTVPKRVCKLAVTRNRIKRLLRESIRAHYKNHEQNQLKFRCFVISWKQAPKNAKSISLRDVQPVVDRVLNRAENYFAKNF